MQHRRPSRAEITFLTGVPLAWAVLLAFHPTGDGDDFFPVVSDEVTAWVVVHIGTLLFIPLFASVVYVLLRGVEGAAAQVARVALAGFVLFYAAWETMIGIAMGLFVDEVNGLPAADQAVGATLVERFTDAGVITAFEFIGTGCLIIALTAAGVALRRQAGAPRVVPVLLVLASLPIAWHVMPFGQFGLALFIAAVLIVVRTRSVPGAAPAAAVRPTPA